MARAVDMAGSAAALENGFGGLDLRRARKQSLPGSVTIEELGYVAFPTKFLVPDFMVPCSLYVPVMAKGEDLPTFVKVLERGQFYSETWKEALKEQRIDELYAEAHEVVELDDYFHEILEAFAEDEATPAGQKARVFYHYGEFIARRLLGDVDDGMHVEKAGQWAEAMVRFFCTNGVNAAVIYRQFMDNYETFTHSVQVAMMAMAFANHLNWRPEDVVRLGAAGLYHDIGKVWVDARILCKPASLTREEFAHIRRHPETAYKHLASMERMIADQLAAVRQHHESMDGTGYPLGLKGSEIHPFARVLHICDCFDAITTHRPYKKGLTPFKALKLMQSEMRLSFDRHLLYKFIQFLGS
ncbi:MAG: HD-GYP domain-containing protein [Desulfosoma sp.]|uniref:HD-GYP domain-containing protein n=1 Tax=Desulfosoma sp. TaxID=2603217 RepID=UPI00404AB49D